MAIPDGLFKSFSRPTALGVSFNVHTYHYDGQFAFVLQRGDLECDDILVRVHSACLFGESFVVNSCDCGEQLRKALKLGAQVADFLLVYMASEDGRGHGLETKIRAIDLEANDGLEMSQSFERLGITNLDPRTHGLAATILADRVGSRPIRLMTNNPKKVAALTARGIRVSERVPLVVDNPSPECRRYLRNKRDVMGHIIEGLENERNAP